MKKTNATCKGFPCQDNLKEKFGSLLSYPLTATRYSKTGNTYEDKTMAAD